jgi:hypothetical protein
MSNLSIRETRRQRFRIHSDNWLKILHNDARKNPPKILIGILSSGTVKCLGRQQWENVVARRYPLQLGLGTLSEQAIEETAVLFREDGRVRDLDKIRLRSSGPKNNPSWPDAARV